MLSFFSRGPFLYLIVFFFGPIYLYSSLSGWLPKINMTLMWGAGLLVTFVFDRGWAFRCVFLSSKNIPIILLLLFFSSYLLLVQALNFATGDLKDKYNVGQFEFNFRYLLYAFFWLFFGIYFLKALTLDRWVVFFAYIGSSIFYILNIDYNTNSIDLSRVPPEYHGLYQGLAEIYAIACISAIGSCKKLRSSIPLMLVGLFILYCLQSRSAMAFTLCASVFVLLLKEGFQGLILRGSAFALVGSLLLWSFSDHLDLQSRMLKIFTSDYSDDASFLERKLFWTRGLEHISNNPLLGGYDQIVLDFNDHGAYIHNILSYWQVYGILGFLLFLTIFVAFPFFRLRLFSIRRYSQLETVALTLYLYFSFQLIFARSYTYMYCWLLVGICLAYGAYKKSYSPHSLNQNLAVKPA
ncbi:O-antigen ligase family protein [Pseudomonas sp. MT3]